MRAICVALVCLLGFGIFAKARANFVIQDIHVNPDGSVTITWPTIPQTPYYVLFADSPTGQWQYFPDGFVPAGSNVTSLGYTDTNSLAVSQRFYKVETPRLPVIMTLVLDRSGSMNPSAQVGACLTGTQGGKYLPAAVSQFINVFDETMDRAALVTFASSSSNDFHMSVIGALFKTPIINAINRINANNLWAGSTCTIAGLTNALVIQNTTTAPANAIKFVVLFTDGQANMTEGVFNGVPLNFGGFNALQVGCAGSNPGASFYRTNAAETVAGQSTPVCSLANCDVIPPTCSTGITVGVTWTNAHGVAQFFCASPITEDATNRCVLIANQLRASSNYVFAVGLSAPGVLAPPTLTTLQQIANDPASPSFDPTQPVGAAFLSTGQDLSSVLQQVATNIIQRLVP